MQKYLMSQFKTFLCEHGDGIGQMGCIHCLTCLSEKFLECFGLCFVGFNTVAKSAVNAVCKTDDKKVVLYRTWKRSL